MKGRIDEHGMLWIERAGKAVKQHCPFATLAHPSFHEAMRCGDWCPHFGTPEKTYGIWAQENRNGTKYTKHLHLCHHASLLFEELIDERGPKTADAPEGDEP